MTLPHRIDLDQYKTQAKELCKQARAAHPEALDRLRQHHPEHESALAAPESVRLADAQLVIARENGFPSWAKFKAYLGFRNAVQALDAGDLVQLDALLDQLPGTCPLPWSPGRVVRGGVFCRRTPPAPYRRQPDPVPPPAEYPRHRPAPAQPWLRATGRARDHRAPAHEQTGVGSRRGVATDRSPRGGRRHV